jgi:hypothetical protein
MVSHGIRPGQRDEESNLLNRLATVDLSLLGGRPAYLFLDFFVFPLTFRFPVCFLDFFAAGLIRLCFFDT